MSAELLNEVSSRISAGLRRKAITTCSRWAEAYRVMGKPYPGPYSFLHHPWCKDMHDCDSSLMVGQKGAQLGFTEVALNKSFFTIDVKSDSVLYILPAAKPDASDFSTSRFDPALELSDHLGKLFEDVRNIGHKRAGSANLFIRGSRSRSQIKSLPVSLAIADELEEMNQKNVALIPERLSGQTSKQFFVLSTPSIPDLGINAYYKNSSEEHYCFKCPRCSRWTELKYPECLIITSDDPGDVKILDSHLICKECQGILDHNTKPEWLGLENAKWVAQNNNRVARGFHISQLYSMSTTPAEIAIMALKAQLNPVDEQEFWNNKLGLPHEVKGARVTDEELRNAIGNFTSADTSPESAFVTMGVDIGKQIHFEVNQWWLDSKVVTSDVNLAAHGRVLKAGKVSSFNELDLIVRAFRPICTVTDANPERRLVLEFAQRWPDRVYRCEYHRGLTGKQISINSDEKEFLISVDRTSWMDLGLSRFRNKTLSLPRDIPIEYSEHMKVPVRKYERDGDGNPVAKFVQPENAVDHHAHARVYSEIALKLGANMATNQNIVGIL